MDEQNQIPDGNNLAVPEEDAVIMSDAPLTEAEPALSTDIESEPSEESLPAQIAGFWRRFFAFTIDLLIIALPLMLFGFAFRDFAFSLGPWGRLIGWGLFATYFGFSNSLIFAGQPIGKKVLKIAVVDQNEQYLSVKQSFLRAAILGSFFLFNMWTLPILANPILSLLVSVIVYGGLLTILYGLIINRTTRQGPHDFFVRSYVINAPRNPDTVLPSIPTIHRRFMVGLLCVGLVIGVGSLILSYTKPTFGIFGEGEWAQVEGLQDKLSADDRVFDVYVGRNNFQEVGNDEVIKSLEITAWMKESCQQSPAICTEVVDHIAETTFAEYENLDEIDGMTIQTLNRFDFGFAKGSFAEHYSGSIEAWQEMLD